MYELLLQMIRQAKSDDAKAINRLSVQLGYGEVTDDVARNRIEQLLSSASDKVWVYQVDDEVVGWIHAFIALRVASAPFIEIGGLAVDSTFRKQGVGRRLIEQAQQWADTNQLSLRVRCNALRSDTHLFYKALGFRPSKEQYVFKSKN